MIIMAVEATIKAAFEAAARKLKRAGMAEQFLRTAITQTNLTGGELLDLADEIVAGQTRLVRGMTFNQRLAAKGYVTSDMGRSRLAAAMGVNPAAVEAEIARRRRLVSNAPRRGGAMSSPPVSNRPRRGEPLPSPPATNATNTFAAYAPYVATALGGGLMGAGVMSYLNNSRHGRTSAELFNQYPYGVY